MTNKLQADLNKRLEDKRFAEEYGSNIAKVEIAVTIAQARRVKNVTQQELANSIGKTQSYIAKLEGGDTNPTIGNVGKILANMGLKLITGINNLNARIENKDIVVSSFDSNSIHYCFSNSNIFDNGKFSAAVVATPLGPNLEYINTCTYFTMQGMTACVSSNNIAEDATDVLWQASKEEKIELSK